MARSPSGRDVATSVVGVVVLGVVGVVGMVVVVDVSEVSNAATHGAQQHTRHTAGKACINLPFSDEKRSQKKELARVVQ